LKLDCLQFSKGFLWMGNSVSSSILTAILLLFTCDSIVQPLLYSSMLFKKPPTGTK